MIKKLILAAALIASLLFGYSPALAQGQDTITVNSSTAKVTFPAQIAFNLSAKSDTAISDIRLQYEIKHESYVKVISESVAEFQPGTTVSASWTLNMAQTGGLPPGTKIDFWWIITDAAGNVKKTDVTRTSFDDARYKWQTRTFNNVNLLWYQGNSAFADQLEAAINQSLTQLKTSTGASLQRPITIFIYANSTDLQGSMVFPQEWSGGVAFSDYDTIAIGIGPNDLTWGRRAITHEIAHLVENQITTNPYNNAPTWFSEGFAMYAEGTLEPQFSGILNATVKDNSLLTVRSLVSPFSADAETAILSYAESYTFVKFLIDTYGQQKFFDLMQTFHEGSTYDGALMKIYNFDLDGMDVQWLVFVRKMFNVTNPNTSHLINSDVFDTTFEMPLVLVMAY